MPLNSQNLPDNIIKILSEIPFDDEAVRYSDQTYQTKVEIYDAKCSGCGFARILAINHNRTHEFKETNEAVAFAIENNMMIDRGCSYPLDVYMHNGKPHYPTLTEIVMNGCSLWNEHKLNIPHDDETEFTEVEILSMPKPEIIREPVIIDRVI